MPISGGVGFPGMAGAAMLSSKTNDDINMKGMATMCYMMADALIEEKQKGEPQPRRLPEWKS